MSRLVTLGTAFTNFLTVVARSGVPPAIIRLQSDDIPAPFDLMTVVDLQNRFAGDTGDRALGARRRIGFDRKIPGPWRKIAERVGGQAGVCDLGRQVEISCGRAVVDVESRKVRESGAIRVLRGRTPTYGRAAVRDLRHHDTERRQRRAGCSVAHADDDVRVSSGIARPGCSR